MPVFSCDPHIELNGHNTNAFLSSLLTDEFMPILRQHGFDNIDVDQWYPVYKILAVLEEIHQNENAMSRLVAIGMAAAENIDLPEEVLALSPIQFMKVYEQLYPTRHRNGQPGTIEVMVQDENNAIIKLGQDVPYPDDVMYGVFYAYARRLVTNGEYFTLKYMSDVQPRREFGGTETLMRISVSPD